MNMFKVTEVNWETRRITINELIDDHNYDQEMWVVKLDYCPMGRLLKRKAKNFWLSDEEKKVIKNYEYFQKSERLTRK